MRDKMLDIKKIREDPDKIKAALEDRGLGTIIIDDILKLDDEIKRLKTERDELRKLKNIKTKEFHEEQKRNGQENAG